MSTGSNQGSGEWDGEHSHHLDSMLSHVLGAGSDRGLILNGLIFVWGSASFDSCVRVRFIKLIKVAGTVHVGDQIIGSQRKVVIIRIKITYWSTLICFVSDSIFLLRAVICIVISLLNRSAVNYRRFWIVIGIFNANSNGIFVNCFYELNCIVVCFALCFCKKKLALSRLRNLLAKDHFFFMHFLHMYLCLKEPVYKSWHEPTLY